MPHQKVVSPDITGVNKETLKPTKHSPAWMKSQTSEQNLENWIIWVIYLFIMYSVWPSSSIHPYVSLPAPSSSLSPCSFHSVSAPHSFLWKDESKVVIYGNPYQGNASNPCTLLLDYSEFINIIISKSFPWANWGCETGAFPVKWSVVGSYLSNLYLHPNDFWKEV